MKHLKICSNLMRTWAGIKNTACNSKMEHNEIKNPQAKKPLKFRIVNRKYKDRQKYYHA